MKNILRRKKWALDIFIYLIDFIYSFTNLLIIGKRNIPETGPALLLAKHRFRQDSLVIGLALYKSNKRYGNFVMKNQSMDFMNYILEMIGGIRVIRKKDMLRDDDEYLKWVDFQNRKSFRYIEWLYTNNETVVSFPEGDFHVNSMGQLKKGVITHFLMTEKKFGLQIPIVLVGTTYKKNLLQSEIIISFDKPVYSSKFDNNDLLFSYIRTRIWELSKFE